MVESEETEADGGSQAQDGSCTEAVQVTVTVTGRLQCRLP